VVGERALTAEISRSGGDLQDAADGGGVGATFMPGEGVGVTPLFWSGGMPTGPLGTLLAAAGVPPDVMVGLAAMGLVAGA
jgi:hypothetical protein